jgi:hypothetical protein
LVVWCAQHPSEKGIVVVGWYDDSTVYREQQEVPAERQREEAPAIYRIECRATDGFLVDYPFREYVVQPRGTPKSEAAFGHSDLSYLAERGPELTASVVSYVRSYSAAVTGEAGRSGGWGGDVDIERNRAVEHAAYDRVKIHYKGWACKDRTTANCGWDLEFRKGAEVRFVEVKGRSDPSPARVVLSSNERRLGFERAAENRDFAERYRLAVVHNAQQSVPELRIYRHREPEGWRCELTGEGLTAFPLGLVVLPCSL